MMTGSVRSILTVQSFSVEELEPYITDVEGEVSLSNLNQKIFDTGIDIHRKYGRRSGDICLISPDLELFFLEENSLFNEALGEAKLLELKKLGVNPENSKVLGILNSRLVVHVCFDLQPNTVIVGNKGEGLETKYIIYDGSQDLPILDIKISNEKQFAKGFCSNPHRIKVKR